MKASHRKDVIIARIIFAFMCLALIGIISAAVVTVSSHVKAKKAAELEAQQQLEQQAEEEQQSVVEEESYVVAPPEEEPVTEVYVRATANVNLRKAPSTDGEIIVTIDSGSEMLLIGEENGWAQVTYNGQTGYVSADYVETIIVETDDASDSMTADELQGEN